MFDVARGDAFGIEREYLVFHPRQAGLAFLDQQRLEAAVAITRGVDLQRTEFAFDGLGANAVTPVGARRIGIGLGVPGVAKMHVHLGFQAAVDHALQELGVQIPNVGRRLAVA